MNALLAVLLGAAWGLSMPAQAQTNLADQPVLTNYPVPGNLLLTPSVEWPTLNSVANLDNYTTAQAFAGYFDPEKCYAYQPAANEPDRFFYPVGPAANRACPGENWSGNFLNWAATQTIDPFRAALTGGLRAVDTPTETRLEKARHDGQGGTGIYPNRRLPGGGSDAALVNGATPFNSDWIRMRIQGLGTEMRFRLANDGVDTSVTVYNPADPVLTDRGYTLSIRVRVCDPAVGLEANCVQYSDGWKPEGTIQRYANEIRYGVFGYLNDGNMSRDGAALRARQKYVGPTIPGSAAPPPNANREWDPVTGVLVRNPDPADATATTGVVGQTIADSGVINYLNKFGSMTGRNHKSFDPVGELYYAGLRYYRNLGNVPEYTNLGGTAADRFELADGFPVITNWNDPIEYWCQRNVILGIGDIYTHRDKNLPGNTRTNDEPARPVSVTADTGVNVVTWTQRVAALEGITIGTPFTGRENSAYMAGLAYFANTTDLRADLTGRQTVSTYWVDVLEAQSLEGMARNQFALTAKYGGFRVPEGFDPETRTEPLETEWWHTNGETLTPFGSRGNGQAAFLRPNNFFTAGNANQMVASLTQAFSQISAELRSFTTSFSLATPQITVDGASSYSAQFDSRGWVGDVTGSVLTVTPPDNQPVLVDRWNASQRLGTQLAGDGWDTQRRVATWNPDAGGGVPFRAAELSAAQRAALNTPYRAEDDSADYLNYVRGDRSQEVGTAGGSQAYRQRTTLLGTIVGSRTVVVGAPRQVLADATNPGYSDFRAAYADRPTVVYVGANDGMLHAFNGSTAAGDANGGRELFAYVPSAVFSGPNGTPAINGLAGLGNPDFTHHFYVDGTPAVFDVDFSATVGGTGGPDWRTMLVGGLGKGGRSFYALDITDPASMTSEAVVADRVLWEFTDVDMGYSFGTPLLVKTAKHGWVVALTSGHNTLTGESFLFLVNPRNGTLLEKIATGVGSPTAQSGLAFAAAFYVDRTDGLVDSIYGGDLLGNVWRFDLRAGAGESYPAPTRLALLTSADGVPQPITTAPELVVAPTTRARYVLVGTGQLLANEDTTSTQMQSFYAIRDGSGVAFSSAADLPPGVAFPIRRADLTNNTDLTAGITDSLDTPMGWYTDFGMGPDNSAYRAIIAPSVDPGTGRIVFAATAPNVQDPCRPAGVSRLYVVQVTSGRSVLLDGGVVVAYNELEGTIRDARLLVRPDGTIGVGVGTDTGAIRLEELEPSAATGLRRLNWREVPTVQ